MYPPPAVFGHHPRRVPLPRVPAGPAGALRQGGCQCTATQCLARYISTINTNTTTSVYMSTACIYVLLVIYTLVSYPRLSILFYSFFLLYR